MSWMAEEHLMWHTANGVPMGPLGGSCPWDACGWLHAELDYAEQERRAEEVNGDRARTAELVPAPFVERSADEPGDPPF